MTLVQVEYTPLSDMAFKLKDPKMTYNILGFVESYALRFKLQATAQKFLIQSFNSIKLSQRNRI
jgi:hypothetical protein